MARGAAARGKRIAFGDGNSILWDHHSEQIFRGNPNVAKPGSERDDDLEWLPFYRGNRIYNRQGAGKWIWNYQFKATPGEIFLTSDETEFADRHGRGFVLIEPNLPEFKSCSPNKRWDGARYVKVAKLLKKSGFDVVQLVHGGSRHQLSDARPIKTGSFRQAMAVLKNAALYIGPEGGLHHGAAAVGVPAVVLFGGFIPPAVTGYDGHINLTGGAEACGSLKACAHCADAMDKITVPMVCDAANHLLKAAP
jgi:ADP-heptose:LPS heptosyltransferase